MIPILIDDPKQLTDVAESLSGATVLFIDTEFESRRSGTQLCLLQVTDGESLYLIDCMTISDLSPLSSSLANPDVIWVVHAGKQDIGLWMKAFALRSRPNIYDTQVAWSLLSAEHQVSLAYLGAVLLGVHREKGHQTDDWRRRPLSDAQIAYAADDAEDLVALYHALNERLDRLERRPLVLTVSRETFEPAPSRAEHLSLSKYRNLWQLNGAQQAALSELVAWYNEQDNKRGLPHYKTLLSVAARLPENTGELGRIKGVNPRFANSKHGHHMIEMIDRAVSSAPDLDDVKGPTPYATYDEYFREAWLGCARAEISAELQMAPEVAFPPWLMKRLKPAVKDTLDPRTLAGEFTGWRECIAPRWLEFCRQTEA